MHATYDPPGTLDVYLGSRLAQAWDMAVLLRTAKALGRHVIALGDFNSPPDSLVVQLLTRYGGVCDSWELLHPRPQNGGLKGLTAEEGAAVLGITCDTPLNSWTSHDPWINQLTGDPIGERLDYIFFDNSEEIQCMRVDVVLQDRIAGIGGPTAPLKNVSDHFAVHAVYSLSLWKPPVPQTGEQHHVRQGLSEETTEVLEQILVALEQHLLKARHKRARFAFVLTPLLVLAVLGLIAGFVWMDNMWEGREGRVVWMAFMLVGVSMLSSGWVVCMFYGWFYGGEAVSGFVNTIQEVRDALE
ncbi:phospholipase C type enzyme [Gamsiella multidivaricata]|nr:phospholipase C type enzyme [Gamsiella multidivaricata]